MRLYCNQNRTYTRDATVVKLKHKTRGATVVKTEHKQEVLP